MNERRLIFLRSIWRFLHQLTYFHDPSNRKSGVVVEKVLRSVPELLTCPICKEHWREHVITKLLNDSVRKKEVFTKKQMLFKYIVDVHNRVNLENNKPKISYDEAMRLSFEAEPGNRRKKRKEVILMYITPVLVLVLLLLVIIYIAVRRCRT